MRVFQRVFLAVCALVVLPASSFAATLSKVNDDALAPLRAATVAKKIRLEKLPLYDSKRSVIDLEEFEVWAPEGKIHDHDANGNVRKLDPTPMRFFRGQVNGDPESFAYFSVELQSGKIYGLVATKDKNFAIDAVGRKPMTGVIPRNRTIDNPAGDGGYDYYLSATTADDMNTVGPEQGFSCGVEETRMVPRNLRRTQTDAKGQPIQSQAITGTQHYALRLEIETDDELYANAGNNVTTETNYITNLTGALSTIYNRDLKTDVVIVGIHTHSGGPGTDQYVEGPNTNRALYEFGTYFHNNPLYQIGAHSSAVFLSGKNVGGGIAWEGVICNSDFFCGVDGSSCNGGFPDPDAANKYGGGYAWCGLIGNGGFGTIPNPDATTGGVLYGMPPTTQNYWPLAEYTHELGHNLAGHHTHCVAITDAERIASGFTDGSPASAASNFVDHCYASEGSGCFSGTNYQAGAQTLFKGTIMSYCHNVFGVGGVPQSRFTFAQLGEPSMHELTDYMLSAAPPNFASNVITDTLATMSGITAPATVAPGSTGNAASVAGTNISTRSWSITNGTITSATTGSAITFTAGPSGTVVLKATVYGANSCGVTDTKSASIVAVGFDPPTNVEAHATTTTNVLVSWVAPATGTPPARYLVYRSAFPDYTAFAFRGFTAAPGTTFNDSVTNGSAYLYVVRSADAASGSPSTDSNRDLATVVIYTNPTLTAGMLIKAADMSEMRTACDAVRHLYGIGAGSYGFSPIFAGSTLVRGEDMAELRVNLNTAITGMGFPAPTYTNNITSNGPLVKAIDFTEVRNWMR